METTIYFLTLIWIFLFIITIYFLYVYNSKPYLSKFLNSTTNEKPGDLRIYELSYLLYHKIGERAFIATIINLINKNIIVDGNNELELNHFEPSSLDYDEKYILEILFKKINKNNRKLKYSKIKKLNSDKLTVFLNDYTVYKNLSKKCIREKMFEDKKGKSVSMFIQFLGIMIIVLNYFLHIHDISVYLLILPIIFISIYYKKTYKRTYEYNTSYFKWNAYKNYLLNKKSKNHYDLMYLELFTSLSPIKFQNKNKFVEIEDMFEQLITNAILKGSRGINGNSNRK